MLQLGQGAQIIQTQNGQQIMLPTAATQSQQPQTIQVQGPNGQIQQVRANQRANEKVSFKFLKVELNR